MITSSSQALRLRLEQQAHWSQAAAVQVGQQPSVDPDSHSLREIRGTERLYDGEDGQFAKQLVGGAWSRVAVY